MPGEQASQRTAHASPAARETQDVAGVLSVLAEPHRLLILRHLRRGPRSAGFLARALGISRSLTSHHLAVLTEAGLVSRQHKGSYVCYSVERDALRDVHRRFGLLSGAAGVAVEDLPSRDDPC